MRGTKQYWFMKQSDLKCMIREYGPPMVFLTFSCAEYDCVDIARYLRRVNDDVPDNYPICKLCTEDPISVSRRFSQKFHAFFQNVVIKLKVPSWVRSVTSTGRRSTRTEVPHTTTPWSGSVVHLWLVSTSCQRSCRSLKRE